MNKSITTIALIAFLFTPTPIHWWWGFTQFAFACEAAPLASHIRVQAPSEDGQADTVAAAMGGVEFTKASDPLGNAQAEAAGAIRAPYPPEVEVGAGAAGDVAVEAKTKGMTGDKQETVLGSVPEMVPNANIDGATLPVLLNEGIFPKSVPLSTVLASEETGASLLLVRWKWNEKDGFARVLISVKDMAAALKAFKASREFIMHPTTTIEGMVCLQIMLHDAAESDQVTVFIWDETARKFYQEVYNMVGQLIRGRDFSKLLETYPWKIDLQQLQEAVTLTAVGGQGFLETEPEKVEYARQRFSQVVIELLGEGHRTDAKYLIGRLLGKTVRVMDMIYKQTELVFPPEHMPVWAIPSIPILPGEEISDIPVHEYVKRVRYGKGKRREDPNKLTEFEMTAFSVYSHAADWAGDFMARGVYRRLNYLTGLLPVQIHFLAKALVVRNANWPTMFEKTVLQLADQLKKFLTPRNLWHLRHLVNRTKIWSGDEILQEKRFVQILIATVNQHMRFYSDKPDSNAERNFKKNLDIVYSIIKYGSEMHPNSDDFIRSMYSFPFDGNPTYARLVWEIERSPEDLWQRRKAIGVGKNGDGVVSPQSMVNLPLPVAQAAAEATVERITPGATFVIALPALSPVEEQRVEVNAVGARARGEAL